MSDKPTPPMAPEPTPPEPKVVVQFLRPWPPYQTNEVAGFPQSKAIELCTPLPNHIPVAKLHDPKKANKSRVTKPLKSQVTKG